MFGAGTGTLTPARCCSPGFWTLFFFEEVQGKNLRVAIPIKIAQRCWTVFIGAPATGLLQPIC